MHKIFLKNARIIDGDGTPAIENGLLVAEVPDQAKETGKILYIGQEIACEWNQEDGDTVVDMEGYSLLPGLINTHVHLWQTAQRYPFPCDPYGVPYRTLIYARHILEALMAGVTTVRSVGGSDDIDLGLKKALEKGMLWGSRLITCGPPIIPHGGHCHNTRGTVKCSGADAFAEAVRTEISKGVDQIKLYYSGGASGNEHEKMNAVHIRDEEGRAACEVAHMLGKRVVAHLSNDDAIVAAVRCGVDNVEHGYSMSEDTVDYMAEKKVLYTPTLTTTSIEKSDTWTKILSSEVVERLTKVKEKHQKGCRYAIQKGLTICTGTDTLPSDKFEGTYATNYEMELLVEAGMKPLQAIKAATGNGADLCEISEITGRLKEGLAADIIAVKGEPDKEIRDMRKMAMVMKGGHLVWSTVDGFEQPVTTMPWRDQRAEIWGASNPW